MPLPHPARLALRHLPLAHPALLARQAGAAAEADEAAGGKARRAQRARRVHRARHPYTEPLAEEGDAAPQRRRFRACSDQPG